MKTVTAFIIEQSGNPYCPSVICALTEAVSKLGSDALKSRISEDKISIDNCKCHYQVRNDALTIVFSRHIGNLAEEFTRLIKIAVSDYTADHYCKMSESLDFIDLNKLITKNFENSGKKVFSSNIEFSDNLTSLEPDNCF